MLKELLKLTLKSIRHRSTRSWLTIIGVVIGVMLVSVILSLGSGLQAAVGKTLQMFGGDLVMVFPGEETNPLVGFIGGQKFREEDLLDLEKISGVQFVMPVEVRMMNVEYNGEKKSIMTHSTSWDKKVEVFNSMQGITLDSGEWPRSEISNEVVVGYFTANNLFKKKIEIGDEIILKTKRMKVTGILSKIGNQMDDNLVHVSINILRSLSGVPKIAGAALVKVVPGSDIDIVAGNIKTRLGRQEVVRDFTVVTPEKISSLVGNVLDIVELSFIFIALISLLVGAVGITNTMYTSVLERTKQIGVMKAIGASSDMILSLFLIESGMIGLVGGVIGIVFGVFIAYAVGLAAGDLGIGGLFSFSSLDFFGFFVILLITFITGVISGILPARNAAKMEPAEALRYE